MNRRYCPITFILLEEPVYELGVTGIAIAGIHLPVIRIV